MLNQRDRTSEYTRRKQRCLTLNICFRCQQPKESNNLICEACKKRENERERARRQIRAANNLCACGQPSMDGKRLCIKCAEDSRNAQQKRRGKFKVNRKCIGCGKNPEIGKTVCVVCNQKAIASAIKKYRINLEMGLCPFCGDQIEDNFRCTTCNGQHVIRSLSRWHKLRNIVFTHYGKQCECCGIDLLEFLEIDHINNNGVIHRQETGRHLYSWIIKNRFPNDLRTLCANCNRGRAKFGVCPHQHSPLLNESTRRERRLKLIEHYGSKCICCDETIWGFLEFDHINNDGKAQRTAHGNNLIDYFLRHRPTDIQLLCSNCNKAKGLYGRCPHTIIKQATIDSLL